MPSPDEEFGSLKEAFKGKTARQLIEDARKEEAISGSKWAKHLRMSKVRC